MRITLMHNPKAGDAEHDKKQLMRALAKAGHQATYQSTKKRDYKKALKIPTDLVLAAGGDGTVGKIGCRLIDSGIPLSVLPLGTANNLARSLGLTASPNKIIGRLKRGKKVTFDVGVARGPSEKRFFFESIGGGLLADYVSAAKRKTKKKEKLSSEQEMARHVTLLHRMLHDYPAGEWKIAIDGENISGRYILWEAMNIRSIGPALYLASQAATRDGQLDFVCVRESDRSLLMDHLVERLAGKKPKFPLPMRRFRNLQVLCKGSSKLHLDDKPWPRKKEALKQRREIEVTVRPSALVILQPGRSEQKSG